MGASITEDDTLGKLQAYVKVTLKERGFDDETVAQKFMLMLEEMGEFAHAARKHADIKIDENKWRDNEQNLSGEAADVFIYLLDICNKLEINLHQAFLDKEEINRTRVWK